MTRPQFGVLMFPIHRPDQDPTLQLEDDLRLAILCDRLGFDEFWFGEHHSGGWQIIGSPELMIAAAAQRTDRIIQLDHLTRGRLIFGVGAGALALDSTMIGHDPLEARRMMEESLDRFRTDSRTLFTHMRGVRPYDVVEESSGQPNLWHQGTLHHLFDGGWLWVIPFGNTDHAVTDPGQRGPEPGRQAVPEARRGHRRAGVDGVPVPLPLGRSAVRRRDPGVPVGVDRPCPVLVEAVRLTGGRPAGVIKPLPFQGNLLPIAPHPADQRGRGTQSGPHRGASNCTPRVAGSSCRQLG
jgi:Luciferase-like monooxygenase